MPPLDRYPLAIQKPSPNFWVGFTGRLAVVIHIAEGGFASSIDWMRDHGTSSHFIISLGGTVAQLVGLHDSAWCNGLTWVPTANKWQCPHKHWVTPSWALLSAPTNPNRTTISIEHEGYSGNPWPPAQTAATVALLKWLAVQYPTLHPYRDGYTLIGHRHLDNIDKLRCPGAGIDLGVLAARANEGTINPIPHPEPWMRTWEQRGIQLPPSQIGWAIPQLYKFHAAQLGGCVRAEEYLYPGMSMAVFERGIITYLAKMNKAYLSQLFPIDL